jgi:flagellar basal body-associated protein FliL
MNTRVLIIIGSVVVALLITVGILLVVVIGQNNAAAEQEEHTRHVAICERAVSDPYGNGLDEFLDCLDELTN